MAKTKQVAKDYGVDIQKLFLEMMLTDPQSFVRVQNIYNSDNFDRSLRETAKFINEHSTKFKALPTPEQIKATTGTDLRIVPDLREEHYEWFMEEFESFTRRKELERAILKSADMIEKGEFDPVEKLVKDAVQISLTKDMGTDYFADPRSRLEKIKDKQGVCSTGWPTLDRLLYGGFGPGLQIFAGGSGSGKSLIMQNLAVNWSLMGLNGVYISLELSEELCSMRLDSMVANCAAKDIFKDMDNVEMKVKMVGKKAGNLRIKYMPAQSNVNDIRAYLKELQIQTGFKVDFIMVDYLDLLMPVSVKVSPSDLFVKDKYVSEELRNLSLDMKILLVSASQLNRGAVDEVEFDHSHISGGISKINTADNVFGIFTSRAMRERGKYQIQAMKTRSSNGVGQKIDLDFNVETLRITDSGDAIDKPSAPPLSSIMTKIKNPQQSTNVQASTTDTPAPAADIQSTKLKQMLANLKNTNNDE